MRQNIASLLQALGAIGVFVALWMLSPWLVLLIGSFVVLIVGLVAEAR